MIHDKMFRAMCVFSDTWVYGYLAKNFEGYWIYDGNHIPYLIDVNSLGMATGKLDSQGNMIYGSVEVNGVMNRGGDIVTLRDLVDDSFRKQEFVVEYSNTRFRFILDNGVNKKGYPLSMPDTSVTVIGNQFSEVKI